MDYRTVQNWIFRLFFKVEYRKEVVEMEVSSALYQTPYGRDGPLFPFGKEVNEVLSGGVNDLGGLGFWLVSLENRIHGEEIKPDPEKWSILKAQLAQELAGLGGDTPPEKIGELFEYAVQMIRFWVRKAAGNVIEQDEVADLYEWGARLSADLSDKEVVERIGQKVRDGLAQKIEAWQSRPVRTYRPKGR